MFVNYLFKVNSAISKPADYLFLSMIYMSKEKSENNKVSGWALYPGVGKYVDISKKPTAKGNSAVHNFIEFDLISEDGKTYATLDLNKKRINELNQRHIAYFIHNDPRIERSVNYINKEFKDYPMAQQGGVFVS